MKLVKNDIGTRANGVRDAELSLVGNGIELFSPNDLQAFHHCSVSLRFAPSTLRPRTTKQESRMRTN